MTPRILLGSFEVPGLGGSSTASFSLFGRMQSSEWDVHYVNLVAGNEEHFKAVHGSDVGNPRALSNVSNCWLAGDIEDSHPQITEVVDSISPDFGVAFGYVAAFLLKRAAPTLPVVLVTATCRQAQDYVTSGRAKDAISLRAMLNENGSQPRLVNAVERDSFEMCDLLIAHSALTFEFVDRFFTRHRGKLYQRVVSFAEWICDDAMDERHRARDFADRDIDALFVASDWRRPEKNFALLSAIARRSRGKAIHVVGTVPRHLDGVTHHGLVPRRGDLFDLFGRSRAVVCPSMIDAAPGVLFEASVLGCNVVASRNCGNWELCHRDLLVDPFGLNEFVQAIERAVERKYDDNMEEFLALRSYDDLMKTLDAFGRPFRPTQSQ